MFAKKMSNEQNILVLEDDTALGSGISLALHSSDVQITLCTTIAQARAALTLSRYDLLILDINLPDGSGLALLKEIRKTDLLPVILLTANDMETDIVTGLESGADDYIRLLENAYWFYSYRYTVLPVLLILPVFALLGCAIPAVVYRQIAKHSIVERLREIA